MPNNAVTLQRQSQFTPKMKANAVPRLLSSLVGIDHYNECNRMTSVVEFMVSKIRPILSGNFTTCQLWEKGGPSPGNYPDFVEILWHFLTKSLATGCKNYMMPALIFPNDIPGSLEEEWA